MSKRKQRVNFNQVGLLDIAKASDKEITAHGLSLLQNNLASKREEAVEDGLLDPKGYLGKRKQARNDAKKVVGEVYTAIYKYVAALTGDGPETEKDSTGIAMTVQNMLYAVINKVMPFTSATTVKIDRPFQD